MAVGSFRLPSGGASLIVDFSVDDATPDTNQTITFTDLTVGATSWVWNFGDGTTSTLQNPTKTYLYAGTYTVTLAAENATTGGIETKVGFIVVTLQTIVQTNLQAHYKAPQGATPSNMTLVSGVISQWNDASANAFHITQGTIAQRPPYIVNTFTAPDGNVYSACELNGSNSNLTNTNALFVRNSGNTIYLFMKHLSGFNAVRTWLTSITGTNNFQTVAGSMSYRFSATAITYTAFPLGEYFLLKITFRATNAETRINNLIEQIIATTDFVSGSGLSVGISSNTVSAYILEIACYTDEPNTSNDNAIIDYFNSKFGGVKC